MPIDHLFSYEETGLGVTFERDRQVASFCTAEGIDWQEFQTNAVQRGRRDRRGWNRDWQRVMSDAELSVELPLLTSLCRQLPPELDGMRSRRIAAWQGQNLDFQRGGAPAAHEVLESFLSVRGHGYQRTSPTRHESGALLATLALSGVGKSQSAANLPSPETQTAARRLGSRSVSLRVPFALALPLHPKI